MKSFQLLIRYDSELKETTISSGYNTTMTIPDDETIYDIGESVKYYLKEIEIEEGEEVEQVQNQTNNKRR